MTYQEVSDYICTIPRYKEMASIAYARELLDELGVDETKFKIIHVTGTNGKGSTCCFLDSILRAAGHRTALFTSPHLVTIRERIRVDGVSISEELFIEAYERVMDLARKKVAEGKEHPTFFEYLLLMLMWVCDREQVEYIVLETGMGGRMDTTNIIRKPVACVITTISYDHMKFLGTTIPEIASEKAGIIKDQAPVIYLAGRPEAIEVIRQTADEMGSVTYPVSEDAIHVLSNNGAEIVFDPSDAGITMTEEPYTIRTSACYQPMNATLALKTAEVLEIGTPEIRKEGLYKAHWPARMDEVSPGIYIDGGHNPEGTDVFLASRQILEEAGRIPAGQILVFAVANTKDYTVMVEKLSGVTWKKVIATQFHADKSVHADELADAFAKSLKEAGQDPAIIETFEIPEEAYHRALEVREEGDVVYVAGSLYLAGNILGGIHA